MRTFITLGRKHGDEDFAVITGPEVEAHKQRTDFKELITGDHDYQEIQLWSSSGGVVKRKKFAAPETDLEEKNVAELKDLAQSEGIDLKGKQGSKKEIIQAIKRGRKKAEKASQKKEEKPAEKPAKKNKKDEGEF